MGDIKASSEDRKSGILDGFRFGGNHGCKPPLLKSPSIQDDEENDESDNDEVGHYKLGDTGKPKYMAAQGPTTQSSSALVSTRFNTTKVCSGCKLDIGQGAYREFKGSFFHPQCCCCHTCGRPIVDRELSLLGNSQPYHKACYDDLSHLACDVCRQFISMNRFGPIEYKIHPFWSQKYCLRHDFDYTPRCCCCTRLQPWDATYIPLGDGRKLCSECKESTVMVIGEYPLLYQAVRGFFEGMRMNFDRPIFVRLVDKLALDQAMMFNGVYPRPFKTGYSITQGSEITVLLLYGFPRLALTARLARELMKQWLHIRGYYRIPVELREAICRLVSCWWLESEVKSTDSFSSKKVRQSEAEKRLGEFLLYRTNNTCPAHRGAFLATKAAINKYGLRQTLDHINLTGFLPR